MIFYDKNGIPIAYEDDGVYLFSGKPVAYLCNDAIYNYVGKQLGWFINGWIRDMEGNCVFFTENTIGLGPLKPLKKSVPIKGIKIHKPVKLVCKINNVRPLENMKWSKLPSELFFKM